MNGRGGTKPLIQDEKAGGSAAFGAEEAGPQELSEQRGGIPAERYKYGKLAGELRTAIESGSYAAGRRLPSETELARQRGCSRQTVRQAIDLLEAEGYVSRMRGSGAYVKERPATVARVRTIGVISTYVDDYIFSAIIRGIETVLTAHGCTMQLAFTHNRAELEAKALLAMLDKGVDGLIVEPTKSGFVALNQELYLQIRDAGIPLLFFNAYYPAMPFFPHVAMDDQEAGRLVTAYLLQKGHRRIAGVFQADDLQGQLRYAGYVRALMQRGLMPEPEHVLWFTTQDISYLAQDMDRILRTIQDCTALVCYNDRVAFPICRELANRGVAVPEELAVISIDNSDLAIACDPPLTSAAHPGDLLGRTAAEQILRLMEQPDYKAGMEFRPELEIRQSTESSLLQKSV